MKSKKYFISQKPLSTQVSFVVNTVKGDHLGKQNLIISVNKHIFILGPRTIQKRFRFYDSGFTLFVDPNTNIQISIGVFTPAKNKGYLHSFVVYKLKAPTIAKTQGLELQTYGHSYNISLSLYVAPCFSHEPVASKVKSPISTRKRNTEICSKKDEYSSSFSDKFDLSYTVSPSTYSETSNDDDKKMYDDKPYFPDLLTSFETDETSTMNVSSNSD